MPEDVAFQTGTRREQRRATDFIYLIEKEENTWRVNAKWARDVLEIVIAAYESAKTKRAISLSDP